MLEIPTSVKVTNPVAVDFYYGPWTDLATAKSNVPLGIRTLGLKVFITSLHATYIWRSGITDADLVVDLENLDAVPTENSLNPVESGGVFDALATKANLSGATFTGSVFLAGDATNALQPVTYSQFLNYKNGLNWKHSVRATTTGALPAYNVSGDFLTLTATANGALPVQDGVTLASGDELLVKNEAGTNKAFCGGYTVTQVGSGSTPWILTRMIDSSTAAELEAATYMVREGSTQANQVYAVNVYPITLGTTQITFALTAGPNTYMNGTGLALNGNVFSLDLTYTDARYAQPSTVVISESQVTNLTSDLDSRVKYSDIRNAANFGLTASLSDVAHYDNPTGDQTYRVGGWINLLTVSGGDSVVMQVTWTDNHGTVTTRDFFPQGVVSSSLTTVGNYGFPTMDFRVKSGTTVQVSTTVAGSGSIIYEAGATIQKIQGI